MGRLSSLLRSLFGCSNSDCSTQTVEAADSAAPETCAGDQENLATLVDQNGPLPIDVAIDCVMQASRLLAENRQPDVDSTLSPGTLQVNDDGDVSYVSSASRRVIEPQDVSGKKHIHRVSERATDNIENLALLLVFLMTGRLVDRIDDASVSSICSGLSRETTGLTGNRLRNILFSAGNGCYKTLDDFLADVQSLQSGRLAVAG